MIWLVIALMALTVYRATRLITKDTFPPVLWLRDTLAGGWRPLTGKERLRTDGDDWPMQKINDVDNRYVYQASWSPYWLAELVTCPWCASGWIAGALTLAVDLTYGVPVPWLVGPAVWGAGALLASQEWA